MLAEAVGNDRRQLLLNRLAGRDDVDDGVNRLLTEVIESLVATPDVVTVDLNHNI